MSEYQVGGREVDEAMLNRLEYAIQELATLEEDNDLKGKSPKYHPPSLDMDMIDEYQETFDRAKSEMEEGGLNAETQAAFVDMLQDLYVTAMLYSEAEDYIVETRENRKDSMLTWDEEKAAKNQREQDEYYDRKQEYRQTAKIAMTWLDMLDGADTEYEREAREEYQERKQEWEAEKSRDKLLPDD